MYAEISAVISSAKTALDLAKAVNGLAHYNELVSAVSEVSTKLYVANTATLASIEKQSALTKQVGELEKELVELKAFQAARERYILHALPSGMLTYSLKEGMEDGEPHHHVCANCLENRKIKKLQPVRIERALQYKCHGCGTVVNA